MQNCNMISLIAAANGPDGKRTVKAFFKKYIRLQNQPLMIDYPKRF